MLSRMEMAVGSATVAGGCTWQLVREIFELPQTPGDPLWLATVLALLLGSLAVYAIMVSLLMNEARTRPTASNRDSDRARGSRDGGRACPHGGGGDAMRKAVATAASTPTMPCRPRLVQTLSQARFSLPI
eukprot:m.430003 g.430003  ORF g.430003 m.430003 type:complete len:130 (-) comp77169_c0_seq1:383-772(-)